MPTKVLIADDSWIARMNLKKILKSLPIKLIEAEDGNMAIKMIREDKPDLVLLDLLMPGMDGTDILRIMKDELIDIPTIVLSADIQETTVKKVKSLGAVEFLHKPADPSLLKEIIQKTIQVN